MTTINRTREEKYVNKIILLGSSVVILVVSVIIGYILISSEINSFKNHLSTFKKTLIDREKFSIRTTVDNLLQDIRYEKSSNKNRVQSTIKNQTTIAFNLIKSLYEQNKHKNKKDIIKAIKSSIKSMVKNEKDINYFILSTEGTLVLNTIESSNEGKNFKDYYDLNGKEFVQEIIDSSYLDNKFVEYMWYKPNSSKITNRISYAQIIKELDLVIGSGEDIDVKSHLSENIIDKIKNQYFNADEFVYIYEVKSLNNPQKYSKLILEKNIQTTKKELEIISQILIDTNYKGNSFFEYDNKLIYSTFLPYLRTFLSVGIDMNYINQIVENETIISNKDLNKKVLSMAVSLLLIVIVFFILSYKVSTKIEKIFKQYRLKVMRNEKNYQLLFNHSNDAFIISKIKDKTAFIRSTNMVAKDISGYGWDIIGVDFFIIMIDLDIQTLLDKKKIFTKVKLKRKDGTIRSIELNAVIFEDKNETLVFSSLRDITKRINLQKEKDYQEQLLIQKSKMASMGEMIGNIAHQWRQPLSVLSGLFFDIESAYDFNELNKKYLTIRIEEANDLVEYMSKTIDDFKEFYNPNAKKEKFSILESVNNAKKVIISTLEYNKIKVDINIENSLYVEGFANEFSQVILNILSNSKDMAIQREIKDPKIEIFTHSDNHKISLHIEDNCGGIDEAIIDKIFEPYFTTKYNYGTGIGLYMSKIIVEDKMGGDISAQNILKNKSRFTIVLRESL